MKAAILVSGHIRDFLRIGRLQTALTDMIDALGGADLYVHTWTVSDHRLRTSPRRIKQDKLNTVLNPVAINIEEPKDFTVEAARLAFANSYLPPAYPIGRILPQWYSLSKAWELLAATRRPYDVIVRHRLDFIATPNFLIKPGILTVPPVATRFRFPFNFILDNHAYGDSEVMGVYAGLYNAIPGYLTGHQDGLLRFVGGHYLDSECLLAYHLRQNRIPVIEDKRYGITIRLPNQYQVRNP